MNMLRIQTVMALAVVAGMAVPAYADNEAIAPGNADHGREIFTTICAHCHNITHETSAVGAPGLQGVLDRHTAEWIDHWIHSPEEFAKTDPTAKKLIGSNPYGLTMPTLPETQDAQNRRDIIEFLKTLK